VVLSEFPKKLQMSTFMNARGMPFGSHEVNDGAHPSARPGGGVALGSKTSSGGRFKSLNIFEKKIISGSSASLLPSADTVPRTRNVAAAQPPGGYRLGAKAPPKMSFLQITMWIHCPPRHFPQYSEWRVRGPEHPQNRPRTNLRFFAPTFDPLGVPPQKFWL